MKDSLRARVAAVVGAAATKRNVDSVFNYAVSKYQNTAVQINGLSINGFDYTTNTHFSGTGNKSGGLDFYDYETSSHVQLTLNNQQFEGYDYHTSSHYSGSINGNSISIYDYETQQNYNFSF